MDIDIVDDLKQPAYTGENRCEPCTILNLAIAVVVGSLIARKSRLGGLLAVGISIALIYLRGYLVPGTPTLTKRYLPNDVLRWFGKEPEPEIAGGFGGVDSSDSTTETPADVAEGVPDDRSVEVEVIDEAQSAADDAEEHSEAGSTDASDERAALDLETYFLEHDVLEPCAEKDDLCLTDAFETAWLEAIEDVEESGLDTAAAIDAFGFDADPEEFDIESRDDTQLLVSETGMAGRWPSRAALLADVGASRALDDWVPDWDAHDRETKGQICNGLRMFLETCPTGGEVSMGEEVVESCCTSHDVVAVTCDETGERLFEQRLDSVDA